MYRERIAGTYHVSSYFLSKLVASFPNALVVTLLHTVLLWSLAALRRGASSYFVFFAAHLMMLLCTEGITYVVTAATRSEQLAAAMAPLPLVIGLLFAGVFIDSSSIPAFLRWIRYFVPLRWTFVVLVKNQFPASTVFACSGPGCVRDGRAAVDVLVPEADITLSQCFAVLVALMAAFWVLTYGVLRLKPHYDTSV